MKNRKLKIIDFSDGIRSREIEENFDVIQYQIDKERASVGGPGISYGLNCSIKDFSITISEGCLINNEGEEVYIDETILSIEKPVLLEKIERLKEIDINNRIYLTEIPYSINRNTTSDNVELSKAGILVTMSGMAGDSSKVNIVSVEENVVTLSGKNGGSLATLNVDARYYYTYKRRDVIYIDKEFKIKYKQGITSPSPSIPELDKKEYTYILGYIEVDGHYISEKDNHEYANARFIKEFKSIRNVYTDDKNKLYLCGTPFDSIKVIHMVEPRDPEEDTLWYDDKVNKLKIWRHTDKYEFVDSITFESSNPNHPQRFKTNVPYLFNKDQLSVYVNNEKLLVSEYEEGSDLTEMEKQQDHVWSNEFRIIKKLKRYDVITYRINRYDGFAEWVAINDSSYVLAQERFIWTPEYLDYLQQNCEHDLQYFFFDANKNRNMLYVPNKNCIEIMINQVPLHSDQFDEVTLYDAIASENNKDIRNKLIRYYNYKEDMDINTIHEEYENIGIGFRLDAAMKKKRDAYVEAIVTQRVNANPLTKRFQRAATFITEGSEIYSEYTNTPNGPVKKEPVFKTSIPFRYKEHQLEVFINGRRLQNGIEFEESSNGESIIGSSIDNFKILPQARIEDGDLVSYKISTTVYSYDHLEGLLSGFEVRIADIERDTARALKHVDDISQKVDRYTEEVRGHIDNLKNIENNLDSKYMLKTTKIGKDNLNATLFEGIAAGLINKIIVISEPNEKIDITQTCSKNDFVILNNISSNKMLCRDTDYSISEEDGSFFLNIITHSVQPTNQLYLTGIRFNRA